MYMPKVKKYSQNSIYAIVYGGGWSLLVLFYFLFFMVILQVWTYHLILKTILTYHIAIVSILGVWGTISLIYFGFGGYILYGLGLMGVCIIMYLFLVFWECYHVLALIAQFSPYHEKSIYQYIYIFLFCDLDANPGAPYNQVDI